MLQGRRGTGWGVVERRSSPLVRYAARNENLVRVVREPHRQMMRWVKSEEVGDTEFLIEEQVHRCRFMEENERVIANGGPEMEYFVEPEEAFTRDEIE